MFAYRRDMPDLSPTASRTRTTILTSTISLLAGRPEASMTDIATTAGVSRSTLHRYFPDRATLRRAIDELAHSAWTEAVRSARLEEDSGLEAFRRLCAELLDRLDVLAWWMTASTAEEEYDDDAEQHAEILAALERGRADGSIDPSVRPVWLDNVLWAVLYAVHFTPAATGLTSFDAREQGMRTLMKAAAADPRLS